MRAVPLPSGTAVPRPPRPFPGRRRAMPRIPGAASRCGRRSCPKAGCRPAATGTSSPGLPCCADIEDVSATRCGVTRSSGRAAGRVRGRVAAPAAPEHRPRPGSRAAGCGCKASRAWAGMSDAGKWCPRYRFGRPVVCSAITSPCQSVVEAIDHGAVETGQLVHLRRGRFADARHVVAGAGDPADRHRRACGAGLPHGPAAFRPVPRTPG